MTAIVASRAHGAATSSHTTNEQLHAVQLLRNVTDPRSGQIDTQRLAYWVADAQRQDPDAASQAYALLEVELSQRNPADAGRFAQDVVQFASTPAASEPSNPGQLTLSGQWASGQYLSMRGDRTLINNPILEKRWEFTQSAWTGKGGPTGPLKELLESNGITVVPGVNAPPAGSHDASQAAAQGMNRQQANNHNGAIARDAIADRFRTQGHVVSTEAPRLGGSRIVDVVADQPANDPRYATRVETESKVGRTGATSGEYGTRAQVTKDVRQLADNRSIRAGGEALSKAGRIVRPLGIALDAINVAQAFRSDGNRLGENTGRATSGLVGGAAGAWGGAAAGAAIGSFVPVVGTVIGGIVGGILGGLAGDAVGKGLFNSIHGLF